MRGFWWAFFVRQGPVQLRRNRQPLWQRPEPSQKLWSLRPQDGKPDLKPTPLWNQIGSHEEDEVANGSQPPFEPTTRQDVLPKACQKVVGDTAQPKGRIGGVLSQIAFWASKNGNFQLLLRQELSFLLGFSNL